MEKSDMQKKIMEIEDFVHAPKFGNSLNKVLAKSDNVLENNTIGRLLMISAEEVERIYQESVLELKKELNPDGDKD